MKRPLNFTPKTVRQVNFAKHLSEMTITQDNQFILDSIHRLDAWLSENNWKAYDPFDGLNTRASNLITFNNHYLRIILQQGVRRFPVNLRPILGIRKETSSKGMGFLALAYLKRLRRKIEILFTMVERTSLS